MALAMTHKGKCIGGPLDGREFLHDYWQFRYPVEERNLSYRVKPDEPPEIVTTLTFGIYSFDMDTQTWKWSL